LPGRYRIAEILTIVDVEASLPVMLRSP